MTEKSGQLNEAIKVLEELKRLSTVPIVIKSCINTKLLNEAIDTVVSEICEHHWLPIGEWDGVMMMQCAKCNLYREGEGKKTCVHPYAFVYGGCGKPERCLRCGEILSD